MDNKEIQHIRSRFEEDKLDEKYQHWAKFLESVRIDGLRGWSGQQISFPFPVVALAGANGSGKSTVLKVAACAYHSKGQLQRYDHPRNFFGDNIYWDPVENATLSFSRRQGTQTKEFTIDKKKKEEPWNVPDRPERFVFFFDISRTLPLDTSANRRIAQNMQKYSSVDVLDKEYIRRLSRVLGRNYYSAQFVKPTNTVLGVSPKRIRDFGLLKSDLGEISHYHQGAGENATHNLFRVLQSIPPNSLVIIDEVEASLHPKAQRYLVQFLLWFSRRQRAQIILSTHSPYVLQELPSEARILLLRGPLGIEVIPGVTPEFAMSRIDQDEYPELYLFCEDEEACALLREIIKSHEKSPYILPRLSFNAVGPANDVKALGRLSLENRLPYKGYGVLDGDQKGNSPGCIKLPGGKAPEQVVFYALRDGGWIGLPQRFGIEANTLFTHLEDAMVLEHHEWITYVGKKIDEEPEYVWKILTNQWCKLCLRDEDRDGIVNQIEKLLETVRK